jgi:hypothetical protein
MSCSTSSRRRSREALGIVKYFLGRIWVVSPWPRAIFPATSAAAVVPKSRYMPLRIYRKMLRYLAAKMKMTDAANEIAVARGFFQLSSR